MTVVENIGGHGKAISHFGHWPSFHDSEVVSITLERDARENELEPVLIARIHAFNTTDKVDAKGYFVTEKHGVVRFRFTGIRELSLSEFNCQNALMDISFVDIADRQMEGLRFEVSFDPAYGVSCSFQCASIEIEGIEPGPPRGVYTGAEISGQGPPQK